MKAQNKKTGEVVNLWYGHNTSGNLRYHDFNGKSMTDKQFDKKYKIVEIEEPTKKQGNHRSPFGMFS